MSTLFQKARLTKKGNDIPSAKRMEYFEITSWDEAVTPNFAHRAITSNQNTIEVTAAGGEIIKFIVAGKIGSILVYCGLPSIARNAAIQRHLWHRKSKSPKGQSARLTFRALFHFRWPD